jgi:hypothetical protein
MNYKALFNILWKSILESLGGAGWKFFTGSSGALAATLLFGKNFLNTTLFISVVIGCSFFVFYTFFAFYYTKFIQVFT